MSGRARYGRRAYRRQGVGGAAAHAFRSLDRPATAAIGVSVVAAGTTTFKKRAAVLAAPRQVRAALPRLAARVNDFLGRAVTEPYAPGSAARSDTRRFRSRGRLDAVPTWSPPTPATATPETPLRRRGTGPLLRELLRASAESALDASFVNTFARYDLPHTETDDDHDFEKASLGVVKILADGRTGTTYPGPSWEPRAAFHTLAEYGPGRSRTNSGPATAR
ncbi:hypothetical protein ACIP68_02010 [Streptomyces griseoviridis]